MERFGRSSARDFRHWGLGGDLGTWHVRRGRNGIRAIHRDRVPNKAFMYGLPSKFGGYTGSIIASCYQLTQMICDRNAYTDIQNTPRWTHLSLKVATRQQKLGRDSALHRPSRRGLLIPHKIPIPKSWCLGYFVRAS
jgi:hypothetical protein